jgi:hypothetical protein
MRVEAWAGTMPAVKSTGGAPDAPNAQRSIDETPSPLQEVDVFYNDGVNWPARNGSPAHDCFAGYTGFLG